MARSEYVYLVWDRERREPLRAFTVKYEALGFLARAQTLSGTLQIVRFRHGETGYQVMS
jgi:hypothetical protein